MILLDVTKTSPGTPRRRLKRNNQAKLHACAGATVNPVRQDPRCGGGLPVCAVVLQANFRTAAAGGGGACWVGM